MGFVQNQMMQDAEATGPVREWIPRKSLGGIRFGSDEANLMKGHGLTRMHHESAKTEGCTVYGDDSHIRVYCEHGKVKSITVDDSLNLQGQELFGQSLAVIADMLKHEHYETGQTVTLQGKELLPVYFDDLGLILWMSSGKAVSASCDLGE